MKNIKVGRRRTGAKTPVRQPSRTSCIDFKAALNADIFLVALHRLTDH